MPADRNGMLEQNFCCYVLLLVLLTFPLATYEFGFGFDGTDDDNNPVNGVSTTSSIRMHKRQPMIKKRAENKFQFHKIQRVYIDDYIKDENDDVIEKEAIFISAGTEVEGEDDASKNEDDATVRFSRISERVHQGKQNENEVASDSMFSLFLHNFISNLFGDEQKQGKSTNNIIDWLKWLSDHAAKVTNSKPASFPKAKHEDSNENWLGYLNRWPFNIIFPIGQAANPKSRSRRKRRGNTDFQEVNATVTADSKEQPMSQQHFERLLYTLPSFAVNTSYVEEIECRQQLQIFHRQLHAHKLWTLQMLDATGKITSGILRGNINQLGDFDLCTQIRTLVKVTPEIPIRIRGKYCLAQIETQTDAASLKVPMHLAHGRDLWSGHLGNPSHFAPRYAVANWGICLPHACSAAIVRELLDVSLNSYNKTGIEFHIEVNDDDCYVRQNKRFMRLLKKDISFSISIFYIGALILLSFIALLWEHWLWINTLLQKLGKGEGRQKNKESESTNKGSAVTEEQTSEEPLLVSNEETANGSIEAVEDADTDNVTTQDAFEIDGNNSFKLLTLELLRSFSPQLTLQTLLSADKLYLELSIIYILKLSATLMLYICLKFLMIGHLPLSNRDTLVHALDHPFSMLFRAPLIYSDILLILSGFLAAYQLSEEMEQKSYIQILKCVASKATRYLPTLYVVLVFQTWILPHMGAGPLWNQLIGENAKLCEKQMWRNAFSIQNVIDFEETCSPLTLQLAIEVQLYLLAPLIVWLYYTDADMAFFSYGAVQAMSVAARYARTQHDHLSLTIFHGMNVSKFYRTANLIYASPISRATPYLLGIAAGLLYRNKRNSHLELSSKYVKLGWLLSFMGILWCFWSPAAGMRTDFIYIASDAAAYAAWSPLILSLAICWCVLMFPRGENSVLNSLSSSKPILLISRIAYPVQLAMYVTVLTNTASIKETFKYSFTDLEIGSIICLGIVLAFLIEVPAQRVRRLIIIRIFIQRIQPESTVEPSEVEQSEAASRENITSDTPELSDTIWALDPEEEKQKYVTRRRSLVVEAEVEQVADKTDGMVIENKLEVELEEVVEKQMEKDDEAEIEEAAEVKKRPETPPIAPAPASTSPPATTC